MARRLRVPTGTIHDITKLGCAREAPAGKDLLYYTGFLYTF